MSFTKDAVIDQLNGDGKHRCRQTQCAFFLKGGCQSCDDCKASPFEINEACSRCHGCENLPDSLRWGISNKAQKQAQAVKVPQIIIEVVQ